MRTINKAYMATVEQSKNDQICFKYNYEQKHYFEAKI